MRTIGGRSARLGPAPPLRRPRLPPDRLLLGEPPRQDGVPPHDADRLARFHVDLGGTHHDAPSAADQRPVAISATVAVPIPANVQITAAEAADGAVFVAPESHDSPPRRRWCGSSTRNGPAADRRARQRAGSAPWPPTPPTSTSSPTAACIGYTRSTGDQMGQWKPAPHQHGQHLERRSGLDGRGRRRGAGHDRPGQRAERLPVRPDLHRGAADDRPGDQRRLRSRRFGLLRAIGQPPGRAEPVGRHHSGTGSSPLPTARGAASPASTPWPAGWSGSATRPGRAWTPS